MEHTTSNDAGPCSTSKSSTDVCLYVRDPRRGSMPYVAAERAGSAEEWREAIDTFDDEASIPVVWAPRRARLYQARYLFAHCSNYLYDVRIPH